MGLDFTFVFIDGPLDRSPRVSDNGGEQWQIINAHLPPNYAVRPY
jgi:hypothetical protein